MHKYLAFLSVMILSSISFVPAFANTLDTEVINIIHEQTQTTFMRKCQKEMTWATETVCRCLTDKVMVNMDDEALRQCMDDESGRLCISKVVSKAAEKALSEDNLNVCSQQNPIPHADHGMDPTKKNNTKVEPEETIPNEENKADLSNETPNDIPAPDLARPNPASSHKDYEVSPPVNSDMSNEMNIDNKYSSRSPTDQAMEDASNDTNNEVNTEQPENEEPENDEQ